MTRSLIPSQYGAAKRFLGRRIRHRFAAVLLGERLEVSEFPPPAFAHGARQGLVVREVDEEQERRRGGPFLAHVEQWNLWREQESGMGEGETLRRDEMREPFSEAAVAGLIMVLQKSHEGGGRKMRRRLTAWRATLVRGGLALVGEAFRQRPGEMFERPVGKVLVIAFALAGQQRMPGVVDVVGPLRRVQTWPPVVGALEPA